MTVMINLCECGYGTEIPIEDKWENGPRFVRGHQNRGIFD